MENNKPWFLAEMIFRLHNSNRPSEHRFEKYYFPLRAASERMAYQKALIRASVELENRKDYTKEYLQWEFIGLESLQQIEKVKEETAYHQRIPVPTDIPSYVHHLRVQNETIQLRLIKAEHKPNNVLV